MLVRWNDFGPFDFQREFNVLRQEVTRLFEDQSEQQPRRTNPTTFPRIGLFDSGTELVLRAELPGVAEDDLDVSIEQNTLTLRGTRKVHIPDGYAVHRQERSETTFARSYNLPTRVDPERSKAILKNGVLELTMDKAPELQPRKISVKAG
jgi:HSP20 family protein